jgi:diguanylate cyclase (GGDEF)-like protein/PAS domain S-box-containing protein
MYQTTRHRNRYRAFAQFVSIAVTLTGFVVIAGWASDTPSLTSFPPDSARIKFNSGVCLALSGLSLYLLSDEDTGRARRWTGQIAAAFTALLGCVTLAQYLGGWDFGIDQWLYPERDAPHAQYPGRMAFISSAIFVLMGAALFLLGEEVGARWIEGLILFAMFNAMVPAIGYLYGKSAFYQIPYYGTIPMPVTLAMILICAGILAARPDRGLMALLANRSAGGITARRLLPAAIFLPVILERLQFWGYQTGYYDITVGMISITLSSMLIFALLIGWNARLLLRLDAQRGEAEDALRATLDILETNLHALTQTNRRLLAEANERRVVEETLFHEHERAQVTLNSIGDGVITTDIEGRVLYLNRAAETMSGWGAAEAVGRPIHEVFNIVDPVTRQPVTASVPEALARNTVMHLPSDAILIHRDGSESAINDSCAPIHDRKGMVIGAVLVFHDVSVMRAMSLRMSYIAQHDPLTDLPNRFLLNDRLSHAIAVALRHATRAAVLFLDLDRFKHVNDTLGHLVGDHLLQEIALRIKACMRDSDTVSRHSGDEFIILLQEINDSYGAARAAGQLVASITEPYFIDGHEIHITCSIGISMCPEDGEDPGTMIKHAEAAMYQAKSQGRNNYQFFTRRVNERTIRRFALEGNLRRAIAREESALFYQPKMNIADGSVTGAEALIRWNDRHNGLVPPAQFIPIAEESGLIIPIGEWALRTACRQIRSWQDAGYAALPVAVNVSAVQFREKHFVELVERVLEETRVEPRYLELELTESATMQDLDLTVSLLESLKKIGVGLSIDDFGTGYSSLSYLKRLPIDTLKIDRSFVQDIATDADSAAIAGAIISMAKSLKQKVVAEGVETQDQFDFLREQGCDQIQGFFFSEPLASQDFEHRILRSPSGQFTLPLKADRFPTMLRPP